MTWEGTTFDSTLREPAGRRSSDLWRQTVVLSPMRLMIVTVVASTIASLAVDPSSAAAKGGDVAAIRACGITRCLLIRDAAALAELVTVIDTAVAEGATRGASKSSYITLEYFRSRDVTCAKPVAVFVYSLDTKRIRAEPGVGWHELPPSTEMRLHALTDGLEPLRANSERRHAPGAPCRHGNSYFSPTSVIAGASVLLGLTVVVCRRKRWAWSRYEELGDEHP